MKNCLTWILIALTLAACGGGGSDSPTTTPSTNPPPTGATPVQFNFGDDPADRLLAVNVMVDSIALNRQGGGSVVVMSTPRPMEMMRLMGTVAPLALANVAQGTYTGASMTFGSATVMHVDPVTGQPVQRQVAGPITGHMNFSTPLVVGTSPMVVNVDMNMWSSIGIDAAGNVSMTPALTAHHNAAAANSQRHEEGGVHGVTGVLGAMGSNAFTLSTMQGLTGIPMTTHSGTHYDGTGGMHMMGNGQIVSVEAMLQSDGTWRVDHVESLMASGGAMSSGVVTTVTGSPPTQLVLAMHEGAGGGMTASNIAGTTTVNISGTTSFTIDSTSVGLANLPFTPRFDRTSVSAGQRVAAVSSTQMAAGGGMHGMMGGGTLTATTVRLGEQGLRGTVSGYTASGAEATFTLTFPAESAFAKLTGKTTVTVYQRANTLLSGATSVTNGSLVQVRGLLFNDAGSFRLVASRIRS